MAGTEVDGALREKRTWVTRVLGIRFADDADAPDGGLDPAEIRGRLNETGLRLRDIAALPEAAEVKDRFAGAVAALKAGRLEEVAAILDEIEPLIVELLPMARGQEAARVIGGAKAWRDAVAGIAAVLAGFRSSVIAMLRAEEHEPEEIADVGARLDAEIADITGTLSEGLADQVDAVINGDPARRDAGVKTITARIQAMEEQIVNHEGVDAIEDNGAIPIQIRAPARAALDELRAALAEAAGQASKRAA